MAKKGTQKTGCGKPHHAYGSRRKKKEFSGKMCASATFHHLFYALMCIMGFNVDHSQKKKNERTYQGKPKQKRKPMRKVLLPSVPPTSGFSVVYSNRCPCSFLLMTLLFSLPSENSALHMSFNVDQITNSPERRKKSLGMPIKKICMHQV